MPLLPMPMLCRLCHRLPHAAAAHAAYATPPRTCRRRHPMPPPPPTHPCRCGPAAHAPAHAPAARLQRRQWMLARRMPARRPTTHATAAHAGRCGAHAQFVAANAVAATHAAARLPPPDIGMPPPHIRRPSMPPSIAPLSSLRLFTTLLRDLESCATAARSLPPTRRPCNLNNSYVVASCVSRRSSACGAAPLDARLRFVHVQKLQVPICRMRPDLAQDAFYMT